MTVWPPGLGKEQASPSRSSSPHSQFSPCINGHIYMTDRLIDMLVICFVHTQPMLSYQNIYMLTTCYTASGIDAVHSLS